MCVRPSLLKLKSLNGENGLQTDSIEAFALSSTGNDTLARELVARSTENDRVEARLKHYWRTYPHGNKVVENWMRLAMNK